MTRREWAEGLVSGALGGLAFALFVALLGWLHIAPPILCWGGGS